MKITFENLGCIEQGSVELNDFTIFCGKNNSGKTYAMYAIDYLLTNDFIIPPFDFSESIWNELKKSGTYRLNISEIINNHLNVILDGFEKHLKNNLSSFFGVKNDEFINLKIHFSSDKGELLEQVNGNNFFYSSDFLSLKEDGFDYLHVKKYRNSEKIEFSLLDIDYANDISDNLPFHISRSLCLLIFSGLSKKTFLLPAERAGINVFYKELFSIRNLLLQTAQNDNVNPINLLKDVLQARYAKPIKDYLQFLNHTGTTKNDISSYIQYAETVEKEIVKGKYTVDDFGNIFFTPSETKDQLPLHFCSSTVKSLFGLAFYLEHLAKTDDYLMIDEPELNLHPENQRLVARLLAQLVNAGLKVVVSTHSDYFMSELNNLMMLRKEFSEKASLMKAYNYKDDELLDVNRVSAYLFKEKTIDVMKKDNVEGIITESFNQVSNALNSAANEIYFASQEG